ncbi:endonuclease [Cellvibrio zantedeschiae]|uniref:Endonuclease n=1 Tax=Cellvibrio zantedeschiae TaxID=1237077 RepID=A0ABQ3BAJ8_9GAMM|nr:GIY-YIG nuclease family protein [Cellvibrio zantedeschiae]GGY81839.1 endonuclease [Cellvibrio zantedeschiae]
MKNPAVYILASKKDGTLYIGVTSNLPQRIWQHKNHLTEGFTKKYNATNLVYYELTETMESAIAREKTLKKIGREEKIQLIEASNPDWLDLYERIT